MLIDQRLDPPTLFEGRPPARPFKLKLTDQSRILRERQDHRLDGVDGELLQNVVPEVAVDERVAMLLLGLDDSHRSDGGTAEDVRHPVGAPFGVRHAESHVLGVNLAELELHQSLLLTQKLGPKRKKGHLRLVRLSRLVDLFPVSYQRVAALLRLVPSCGVLCSIPQ